MGKHAAVDGWTTPQKTHAAIVSRLDHDVGALLGLRQALDLDQRMLVIVPGDNGSSV